MSFNFNIRSVQDMIDLKELRRFLVDKHLDYPRYEDWVDRAMIEVETGYKTGILAYERGSLVADLVYQPHKELSRVREVKNLRVHPMMRGRGLARFMMKQVEAEDSKGLFGIIIDVHSHQKEMIEVLQAIGYMPIIGVSLYDPNQEEIILFKHLLQKKDSVFSDRIKLYFSNGEIV